MSFDENKQYGNYFETFFKPFKDRNVMDRENIQYTYPIYTTECSLWIVH